MIFNISNGPFSKTAVLDAAYPQDVSVNVGDSATFRVIVAQDGKPPEYTYQWYYDGAAVEGATQDTYTREAELGSHSVFCNVTNKAGSVKSRTATVTADTQWLYNAGTFSSAAGDLAQIGLNLWKNNTAVTNKPGTCTITKNATNFKVASKAMLCAVAYFTKKVDLTGFNTLYFDGEAYEKNGDATQIGVWTEFDTAGADLNRPAMIEGPLSNGVHTLNISAVNEECYIGFLVSGANDDKIITVNSVYLK